MCTAITLQSMQKENFFGRTMDFSYPIEPGLYVIPKNYQWNSLISTKKYIDDYSFICIGQETDGMFGIFDGVNERGFAAAVLYFEGYADYDLPIKDNEPIASLDFLHYILGRCGSVNDLKALLENIGIVGVPDPVTQRAAPLHWIATDRSGKSVVIEQTETGLEVIDNPIGVMANSPDFHWHMTNLRNYTDVSITQQKEVHWGNVSLTPFSQGGGTRHLPGGFTSPERFARTAFLKTHAQVPESRSEAVMTCFHIMNSVFIPKGIVQTDRGTYDYTKYVAFMNTNTCEYYFKTYENNQIITASLWDYCMHGTQPIFLGSIVHPLNI
ncbi:choloylglycine hydrolase [Virgibacillus natechei]|uniref:Choloylglycine hydrolase n=1 Tax=Virgibacillus natechei TaxID=1216297 RepID=A0ABS4IG90_9BACI|nr:choloylglycine hydrolase family protein [Virgibacillus natechei]MBP1969961.1 choloylglycine hydrolase [Virgibacillus natechei]UZD13379.1 choloylglycine hydrolase family protein [Virgibacillus natechei]